MKKLIVFNVLVFIFIAASCSNYKPKNRIYGKWQSEDFSDVNKIILNFEETDFLEVEAFSLSGVIYKESHQFYIVDEKAAVITEITQPEYKTKIRVMLESNNTIRLDCRIQKSAEGKNMIDAPMLCTNHSFKRLE